MCGQNDHPLDPDSHEEPEDQREAAICLIDLKAVERRASALYEILKTSQCVSITKGHGEQVRKWIHQAMLNGIVDAVMEARQMQFDWTKGEEAPNGLNRN